MNARAAAEILAVHRRHGLPFKDSVLFLIKATGFDIGEMELEVGRNRSSIHHALKGACQPNPALRIAVKRRIGLDPWAWRAAQKAQPVKARRGR